MLKLVDPDPAEQVGTRAHACPKDEILRSSGPCGRKSMGVRVSSGHFHWESPLRHKFLNICINYIIHLVYYTYVLQSLKDSTFYIGFTNHLQKRIRQHNADKLVYSSKNENFKI